MPRHGNVIFSDIEGRLAMLRIECTRCGRAGHYRVDRLIETYGRDTEVYRFRDDLTRDCPNRDALWPREHCDVICPDLPALRI